jgi:hypothetical protein
MSPFLVMTQHSTAQHSVVEILKEESHSNIGAGIAQPLE